jgi:hypothetical protein
MRIPRLPAAGRLRQGAYMPEPMNWPRRQAVGTTRYMAWPINLALSGSPSTNFPVGGIRAYPIILPRPYYITQVMILQTAGGYATDKGRLAIYDCIWKDVYGLRNAPYPGRLIWQGSVFNFDNPVPPTKITFNPNIGLPGNKIFFMVNHVYFPGGGSSNFHLVSGADYNILEGTADSHSSWYLHQDANLTMPDPFTPGASTLSFDGTFLWYVTVGDPP